MTIATRRKWLIITGIPIAVINLAIGLIGGGEASLCAAAGMFVAIKTFDLIRAAP